MSGDLITDSGTYKAENQLKVPRTAPSNGGNARDVYATDMVSFNAANANASQSETFLQDDRNPKC